jgi:hypothetical protein
MSKYAFEQRLFAHFCFYTEGVTNASENDFSFRIFVSFFEKNAQTRRGKIKLTCLSIITAQFERANRV